MAYSGISNDIKKETSTTPYHDLYSNLQSQLSADDTRTTDNNDSAEESGESPLDFSIKRKSRGYEEISGSESLSSPTSSLNDTGGNLEERKSSDTDNGHMNIRTSHAQGSSPDGSPLFQQRQFKNHQEMQIGDQSIMGQMRSSDPDSPGPGLPNMLNELQMGLTNASMLSNSFPAMAALMDPRRLAASTKGTRPFKAYPKGPLSALSNAGGLPQYLSSFANFENSALVQGLSLSSEEIFNIYKQQLLTLRERDKFMAALKMSQEQCSSRTSTVTAASPSASLPPSLSSIHLSNKNNGLNNNLLGSIPNGPVPQQTAPSPQPVPRDRSLVTTPPSFSNSNNHNSSGTSLTPGGRRRPRALPDEQKDDAYWERRRKNNDAAKRSRDARRAKEDEIAIRAALLEQENLKLRVEVAALKTETAKLRCMLYNS